MSLSPEQEADIVTNLFFVNLTTEVDNTLTNMVAENIDFDGHLFLVVPNEDVPVRMARNGGDITLDIGIGPGESPHNAPYSLTIPSVWLTD